MERQSLILAIETATGCGSIALTTGNRLTGHLLAEITSQPRVTHSRHLLGSVQWLMENNGVDWEALDGVAVSTGPGSFTGLRIGMAAAKGIAMAARLPLLGVSTLDGLALTLPSPVLPLCCVLDARKGELYAAWYGDDWPRADGPPLALSPQELMERITKPTLLAGPGTAVYADLFLTHPYIQLIPAALCIPRAAAIGFLAAELLACGAHLDPAVSAPLYVRASEAEVSLQQKNEMA